MPGNSEPIGMKTEPVIALDYESGGSRGSPDQGTGIVPELFCWFTGKRRERRPLRPGSASRENKALLELARQNGGKGLDQHRMGIDRKFDDLNAMLLTIGGFGNERLRLSFLFVDKTHDRFRSSFSNANLKFT